MKGDRGEPEVKKRFKLRPYLKLAAGQDKLDVQVVAVAIDDRLAKSTYAKACVDVGRTEVLL